jgi:hypothetical protein
MLYKHGSDHSRSTRLGAGVLGVAAVGLAISACGTTTKTATTISAPSSALAASVTALGNRSSIEARFSIPITATQARQLASMGSSKSPSRGALKALSTGSVFFAEQTGNKGESLDSKAASTDLTKSYDFGVSFGSDTPLEVRYVGQAIYLHLKATTLLRDLGEPASKASALNSELAKLNSDLPGLSTLATGGWVEVSRAALAPLLGDLKSFAASGAGSNMSKVSSGLVGLRTSVLAAIKANSAVTSLGSSGGRQEYAVSVKAKALATSIDAALNSASGVVPSVGNKLGGLSKSLASIPSSLVVTIDAYTSSGKLTEADLNLAQFATKSKQSFPVPLRMTISSASISAPSGAKKLDLSKIPTLVGGLLVKLSLG